MRGEVEDIPEELMQRIQSQLPVNKAARTIVLSKSWLHAWSTNPTLKFHVVKGKKSIKLVEYMNRTLKRYFRDNIPILKFDFKMDIRNRKSASQVERLIATVATKTNSLKEFSLSVTLYYRVSYFTFPDELLLGEKLTKISVEASWSSMDGISVWMTNSRHPMIRCVSLQELHLHGVQISDEALNDILSSCTLLVKIQLIRIDSCVGIKTIKAKNLHRLHELIILLEGCWKSPVLEISGVPNLRLFRYELFSYSEGLLPFNANAHSISLSNVTKLELGGVVPDNTCLDMIKSGFPFLESLTLNLTNWKLGSFIFTCASIKIFSLVSGLDEKLSDLQIYAPNLLSFSFIGYTILPNLLFPVSSSLAQIELSLILNRPVDASFFLKMREALTLSPKCKIHITTFNDSRFPLDIDIDDLRRRLVLPPATNVQQLEILTFYDKCLWERSPFFDAFFEICRPKHVIAKPDSKGGYDRRFRHKNHFCRLMRREVLEKKNTTADWPHQLEHVLIRRRPHKKWKILKSYRRRFLHGSVPVEFKLTWH